MRNVDIVATIRGERHRVRLAGAEGDGVLEVTGGDNAAVGEGGDAVTIIVVAGARPFDPGE